MRGIDPQHRLAFVHAHLRELYVDGSAGDPVAWRSLIAALGDEGVNIDVGRLRARCPSKWSSRAADLRRDREQPAEQREADGGPGDVVSDLPGVLAPQALEGGAERARYRVPRE